MNDLHDLHTKSNFQVPRNLSNSSTIIFSKMIRIPYKLCQALVTFIALKSILVLSQTDCSQYTNTKQLRSSPSVTLSYVSNSTSISMKLSTTRKAWVSIGRTNRAGRMSNAEAAVGKPGNKVDYYIIQSTSNFYNSSNVQLTGTSITQTSSGTVMTFTQKLEDGVVPITSLSGQGSLNFIWAIGCSNDNGFNYEHCSTGSVSITLSPCVSSPQISPTRQPSVHRTGNTPTRKPSVHRTVVPTSGVNTGITNDDENDDENDDDESTSDTNTSNGGTSAGSTQTNTTVTDCTQYRNTVNLAAGSTIQYVSTDSVISMQFSTNQKAWLSIGRSSSRGRMAGSDAIIGLPSSKNVGYYLMDDYSGVNPDSSVTLYNTSITQSTTGTVLKFTQNLKDGRFPITTSSGSQTFVWAIGCSNGLTEHCSQGSFTLRLAPCTANSTGSLNNTSTAYATATLSRSDYQRFVNYHSYLATLAWGLLVPLAVCASFFRNSLSRFDVDSKGNTRKVQAWFILHRALNVIAFVITIAFFSIIVRTVERNGGEHFTGNKSYGAARAHALFGLLFFLLVILQVFMGIFRPHVHPPKAVLTPTSGDAGDDDNDEAPPQKSGLRIAWEYFHRGIGIFLWGCF